jgi:hypothetical protein
MKKETIKQGLNADSTFNKMKAAFTPTKQPTKQQLLEEEQKWANDTIEHDVTTLINEIISDIKRNSKPQLKPLSDEEHMLLPILINYLKKKTNDMVHITAEQIIDDFNRHKERIGMKNNLNIPRLMKLTAYIRCNELSALVSGATGYFISNDPYVILSCYESLNSRAEAIMAAATGMKNIAINILNVNKYNQSNDPFGFDW